MNIHSEVAIKLEKARRLLHSAVDQFYYGSVESYQFKHETVVEVKALVDEAELLLNPIPNQVPSPQLQQHNVSGRSEQLPPTTDDDNYDVDQAFAFMHEP